MNRLEYPGAHQIVIEELIIARLVGGAINDRVNRQ